tara:strand:- start:506 stop:1735 length:1230 start_codon:yes stop_codon:yes gene_type:complete
MDASFEPVDQYNKGLKNGSYWIKVNSLPDEAEIFRIRSHHAKEVWAYDVKGSSLNTLDNRRFPTFNFTEKKENLPFYINLHLKQEGNFPVEFYSKHKIERLEQNNIFGFGLFYGIVLFIILINLFLFYFSKEKSFWFYSFLLFTIAVTLGIRDNIPFLFGLEGDWVVKVELFFHVLIGVSGGFFAYNFVRLKNRYPKLKFTIGTCCGISILFFVTYCITLDFIFYALTDVAVILALATTWFTSLLAGSRRGLANFASLIYILNIIMALDFFILYDFGISILSLTPFVMKMGIVADMLIISFTIFNYWRYLDGRNSTLMQELTLRNQELETLSQYKRVEDINDSYLESLIDNYDLTNFEVKILHALSSGNSEDKIARKLKLSIPQVRQAITDLYKKLGISDGSDLSTLIS